MRRADSIQSGAFANCHEGGFVNLQPQFALPEKSLYRIWKKVRLSFDKCK